MRVYEAIGATLARLGVDATFGLMGDGNLRFMTHLADALGVRYHAARHEAGAVAMADGYARASGRVGVCSVTQGPGVTNALTALTEAQKAHSPILLLAGEAPSRPLRHNQRIDQAAVFASIGVAVERMRSTDSVVDDVARAFSRAFHEQRPVAMSISTDVQDLACGVEALGQVEAPRMLRTIPSAESRARAADLIAGAQRPAILAGRGAVRSGAREALTSLADRTGAVLATSVQAKGAFAGDPFDVGVAGEFASPVAARLLGQADLILAFGVSLDHWTTMDRQLFGRSARIVHCDSDRSAIGATGPVDVGLVGDAAATAEALTSELERREVRLSGLRTMPVHREIAAFRHEFTDRSDGRTIDPRTLMVRLDAMLPRDRTIVLDSGHFQGWPAIYLSSFDGTGFLFSNDFQAVGLGLGTTLGAAVARPDRLAVGVVGDGGLLMSLGELDTLIRSGLAVLVVVVNDAAYGAEVHLASYLGLPSDRAFFPDRDCAAIATAMGARAATIRGPADLEAVSEWLSHPDGVMLLDCKVDPLLRGEWFDQAFGEGGWYRRMTGGGGVA